MMPAASASAPTEAARFLSLMAEGEAVTFQSFDDRSKRRELARVQHGYLDDCAAALWRLNEAGAGIFWCVNYTDGKGRRAANVTAVRALFVDLDGAPLGPIKAASLEPHAVVESSPGKWHAYWLVSGCALEQFTPLQKALAARFGGDPSVCDLPRVMRLPGFRHCKDEPFTTRVESLNNVQPYAVEKIIAALRLQPRRAQPSAPGPSDAVPRAEALVFAAGGRNHAMTRLAGTLRRSGLSAAALEAALLQANQDRCRPPLEDEEVRAIARSVARYRPAPEAHAGAAQPSPASSTRAAAGWPAPMLPGASRVPEISPGLLGGWLGKMAAAVAASTQTPPAMAVMTALAVVAAVVQRRFEVAPHGDGDTYTEPLSLWTLTALGSGNRKTAVHQAMTGVLTAWEKRERDRMRGDIARALAQREVMTKRVEVLKAAAGKTDDNAERQRLQDEIQSLHEHMPAALVAPRLFTGDITSERLQQVLAEQDERTAVFSDEGGIFQVMAGAYSGGLSSLDVFLQGHSGSAMRVDRAGRMAHLDRPALSFGLALQPGILQDTGRTRRFRDSGLMARFLYAVPRSTVGQRDVRDRRALPEDIRADYEHGIDRLLDGMRRPIGAPRRIPFEPAALDAWQDFAQRLEDELGEGGRYAHMSDWASKLPGAVARVACVLALAEHGTGLEAVPAAAVGRAVQLGELLIPHAEAAFALMGAADGETDAQIALAFIQRHRLEAVARRELQKAMEGRFRTLDRLLVAIKLLQDWHVLGPEEKTRGAGRPSIFYAVNPRLFVDNSQLSQEGNSDPSSSSVERP